MKKIRIAVSVSISIVGAAFCAFILRDGQISVAEAVGIFAYLALVRVGVMPANRSKKVAPEEKNPSDPLNVTAGGNAAQANVAWKPAA